MVDRGGIHIGKLDAESQRFSRNWHPGYCSELVIARISGLTGAIFNKLKSFAEAAPDSSSGDPYGAQSWFVPAAVVLLALLPHRLPQYRVP
jgi:hypothetical protein